MCLLAATLASFYNLRFNTSSARAEEAKPQTQGPLGEASYEATQKRTDASDKSATHVSPLEIPRLLMAREAKRQKEYAERAKVDVRDILTSKEVHSIKIADRTKDVLYKADPSRGELLSAEHHYEGDDSDLIEADEEDFNEEGDETLTDLIKNPFSKKKAIMMTP